jgi:putative methionine-R-sulfoxide reductase with GAF domain
MRASPRPYYGRDSSISKRRLASVSDAEQRDVIQMELARLARGSNVVGVLIVAAHIGAFILMEQWPLLVLAGVGAAVVVLWFLVPRIAESDFEMGAWSYSAGLYAAALAWGLLAARGPSAALLLALAVAAAVLLLGSRALATALVVALALLGVTAGVEPILPWQPTDYGGYSVLAHALIDAGLLAALGVATTGILTRLHKAISDAGVWRDMAEGLAQRIERLHSERGKDLRLATAIARLADATNEGQLLEPAANRLHERYNLTNVLVYLLSPEGDYASLFLMAGSALVVRTGAMDAILVGAESPVGQAMARLSPVARARSEQPADSEGFAELAAPMAVDGKLMGALLLQSSQRDHFSEEEIEGVKAAADQLALTLAHMHKRPERVTPAAAGQPWRTPPVRPVQVGAETLAETITSMEPPAQGPMVQDDTLMAPISVQGKIIGALGFREEGPRQLSAEELALVQAVADQVAQAVENLNLLESTERAALSEQLVNDITAQLQRSTSVDEVLQTAAQALQRVLEGYEISIRLSPEALGVGRPLASLSSMGDNEGGESRREEE